MSVRGPRRSRGLLFFAFFAALVLGVLWARPAGAGAAGGELVAQPVFGSPAGRFLGVSPQEAPGEAWALARGRPKIVRYTDSNGWETMPGPFGPGEQPLGELEFAPGALAGRTTPAGGVAVLAQTESEQMLIVRNPGGNLHAVPQPGAQLHSGESLFSGEGSAGVLDVAVEEPGGGTGAFVVPAVEGGVAPEAVLGYDGASWQREPICSGFAAGPSCTAPSSSFHALAIDATGTENAWLLAKGAVSGEGIELFSREAGGGPGGEAVWRQQRLGGSLGALYAQAAPSFPQPSPAPPLTVTVAARTAGQPLTVTPTGVWVDARLSAGGEGSDATLYYDIGEGKVTGSWCDLPEAGELCTYELGSELAAGGGRSFAWSAEGSSEPYGKREITGLGEGAVLELEGTTFTRESLAGGNAGAAEGAALEESGEGWLGATPPVHLTRSPEPDRLASWPVPFRRPLTAIAAQPGAPVGALGSEALAVGADGEVARYISGQGWIAESLLSGSGARATPTLRAVAWPETGRAYAVGDGAAMWVWQKATELWAPDPGEPPNLARANFTGIAFDPNDPNRGYAVGKQGVLLGFGRQWTQEKLPAAVNPEVNFTSIAFAGEEAIATYKMPVQMGGARPTYSGGVLVNDGSGWKADQGAKEALAGAVPERVAGLPDGGAAIVSEEETGSGEDTLIEREGPATPWQAAPSGPTGYPAALAAFREGGQVRAVVSVSPREGALGEGEVDLGTDEEQVFDQPPPGQAPLLTSPYPLPGSGFVTRQIANGWRDEEHQDYPLPPKVAGQGLYDLPRRPDPMLALLISPDGSQGWAVGGETGTSLGFEGAAIQTAGVMRYGTQATPPSNATEAPVGAESGMASFAIGGNAQCAGPCADLSGTGIGPDVWLRAAVGRAAGIAGLHAFLYTGQSVAEGKGPNSSERLAAEIGPLAFGREEGAYARRLGSAAGSLPAFAAPASSDIDGKGSLATFAAAFAGFGAPLGSAPPGTGVEPLSDAGPGQGYYSFDSAGAGGAVRVIVLDYSAPTLGAPQRCWLAGQLAEAGAKSTPAIVVGDRDLAGEAPNAAEDASEVVPILVDGAHPQGCAVSGRPSGASAYFFDYPEQNRTYQLTAGGRSIPAFGSGTLGYLVPQRPQETDFVGASGFLLASVNVTQRNAATNVAPVSARLIPDIGALAIDATDGTLLRRSHPALFDALARRPLAGGECSGNFAPGTCEGIRPDPYVPIPTECQGTRCASGIFPEYSFSSSNPDIADFVESDPGSPNPRNVLLVNEKPVLDPHSGLLCAFNAGTTTVTVSTGGLAYSEKVTVLGGAVQRPCGTTPLTNQPIHEVAVTTTPPPGPAPLPAGSPAPFPPPPPPPPASAPSPAVVHAPVVPAPLLAVATPFVPPPVYATPVVPIVPPAPPAVGQPTPPSGTSPVPQREEEAAYDLVHHMVARSFPPRPAAALAAYGSA
ncbi:MAG: hypothetical protein WB507_08205, partial [Solirubrobacterales bacterium]